MEIRGCVAGEEDARRVAADARRVAAVARVTAGTPHPYDIARIAALGTPAARVAALRATYYAAGGDHAGTDAERIVYAAAGAAVNGAFAAAGGRPLAATPSLLCRAGVVHALVGTPKLANRAAGAIFEDDPGFGAALAQVAPLLGMDAKKSFAHEHRASVALWVGGTETASGSGVAKRCGAVAGRGDAAGSGVGHGAACGPPHSPGEQEAHSPGGAPDPGLGAVRVALGLEPTLPNTWCISLRKTPALPGDAVEGLLIAALGVILADPDAGDTAVVVSPRDADYLYYAHTAVALDVVYDSWTRMFSKPDA